MVPQAPPAQWTPKNDRSGSVVNTAAASIAVCTIFYLLRLLARRLVGASLLVSDYVLGASVIACWVISVLDFCVIRFGLGQHIGVVTATDPTLSDVSTLLKFLAAKECFYALGQVTIKISLLLLYRHLFTSKRLHFVISLIGIAAMAWGIAYIGVIIFGCTPINALWDTQLRPQSYCINAWAFNIAIAIPNTLLDIVVLVIPIREVWKLQLDRRSKMQLTFIFLLGASVCVASIFRFVTFRQINFQDPTYTLVAPADLSSVELSVAIVSASLATLRPVCQKIRSLCWRKNGEGIASVTDPSGYRPTAKRKASIKIRAERDDLFRLPDEEWTVTCTFSGTSSTPTDEDGDIETETKRGIVVTRTFSTITSPAK